MENIVSGNALFAGITDTAPSECQISHCHSRVGIWFATNGLSPRLFEAVFGYDLMEIDWHDRPEMVAVCQRHYKWLRRKDGVTLGYRKVNGKLRAYVKDASF